MNVNLHGFLVLITTINIRNTLYMIHRKRNKKSLPKLVDYFSIKYYLLIQIIILLISKSRFDHHHNTVNR